MRSACRAALRAARRCAQHHRFVPDRRAEFSASGHGGAPPCPWSTKLSRGHITQRGRAGCAAQKAALRAEGRRTRHHRLRPIRPAGFPSSGKGGRPPLPGRTRLSRHHVKQRGHARPPVASLGGRQASPLAPSAQCGGGGQPAAKAASRHGQAPRVSASAAAGRRVTVRHPRCGHTLRFYIRPHFTKCGAVAALRQC